jgi:hypothetical protein
VEEGPPVVRLDWSINSVLNGHRVPFVHGFRGDQGGIRALLAHSAAEFNILPGMAARLSCDHCST